MTENNELNLVISDEEGTNVLTGRSFPNTISQSGSPNAQFPRQTGGLTSPQYKEGMPQYDREYGSNYESQGQYYGEFMSGPKPTLESVSSSQTGLNFESNQNPQYARNVKRHTHEDYAIDPSLHSRHAYAETMSAPTLQNEEENRDYAERERNFHHDYDQDQYRQQQQDAYEEYYEEYGDQEEQGYQEYQDEEQAQKAQSLRDSQLAGPVRYSKMTEEEAALAFENRKRELFSTYLKKGPKKSPGSKSPVGRPRTASNERGGRNQAQFKLPEDDGDFQQEAGLNNLVIYNTRHDPSPIQSQSQGRVNKQQPFKAPSAKRAPSREKKENVTNKAVLARQRKDSPMNRSKAQPVVQKQVNKPKKPTPRGNQGQDKEQSNTVAVGLMRPSLKRRNEENYEAPYVDYNQQKNYEAKEVQRDRNRKLTPADQVGNSQNVAYEDSRTKKQQILNDINNIDEEIMKLETESSRMVHSGDQQEGDSYQHSGKLMNALESLRQSQREREISLQQKSNNPTNRSRSLQRENSIDRKNQRKESPINNANAAEDREKLKRINQMNAEKDGRYADNSQVSIKEEIQHSYMGLNEEDFEHRYDYLYERARIQRESRDFLHERNRQMKEAQEMKECTFSPHIQTRPNFRIEDIVTRTRNWQLQKEKEFQMNEKYKIQKELSACTFYPNGILDRDRKLEFNPNEFYKRNIEWAKRKEAEGIRKQNENHKSMMLPAKRSRPASVSVSRVHDSQLVTEDKASPANVAKKNRLGRSASCKVMKTDQSVERPGSARKKEETEKTRSSHRRTNSSVQQEMKSQRSEKRAESQRSVSKGKENNDSAALQPEILESYALIDNLQNVFSARKKARQDKILQEQYNVSGKLRTLNPQHPITARQEEKISTERYKIRMSPSRSQQQLRGKVPVTSPKFDVNNLDNVSQSLTVRNNRYYVEDKPQEQQQFNSVSSRQRSVSRDSKRQATTPRKAYEVDSKSGRGGSYAAAAQQAKLRRESPFKSKQTTKHFESSMHKSSYSEALLSPFQSLMTSPQGFAPLGSTYSHRSDLNYVSKGLVSPNVESLERKYMSLLDKVSRVTKQLDQVNIENNNLQRDITSMQRHQSSKSALFY